MQTFRTDDFFVEASDGTCISEYFNPINSNSLKPIPDLV